MVQQLWQYVQAGGHIHVRVFTRTLPTESWAKCGDLTFDETEWPLILAMIPKGTELWHIAKVGS